MARSGVSYLEKIESLDIRKGKLWCRAFCNLCGNETEVIETLVVNKRQVSCGCINAEYQKLKFEGKLFTNTQGCEFKVLEYNSAHDIKIQFLDEYKAELKVQSIQIKKRTVKNPYYRSFVGVGYLGVGRFVPETNGVKSKELMTWRNMLERCYNPNNKNFDNYGSRGVQVCESWHNFQFFAEWYTSQPGYYLDGWELEKDLMKEGNLIYSPENCIMAPPEVNSFFKRKPSSGHSTDIEGVYFHKASGKYFTTVCGENGKITSDIREAEKDFVRIWNSKIDRLISKYSSVLPDEVVQAMLKRKK